LINERGCECGLFYCHQIISGEFEEREFKNENSLRRCKRKREAILDCFPSESISFADYFFFLAAFLAFFAAFLAGFFAIAF